MNAETYDKIMKRFDREIFKQQKFLGLVMRVMHRKPEEQKEILANACPIDGTIDTQIEYTKKKLYRLVRARDNLKRREEGKS